MLGLAVIVPFLRVSDENWSLAEVDSLPPWLSALDESAWLKEFSLSLDRPRTAFTFHLKYAEALGQSTPAVSNYARFLMQEADMIPLEEYRRRLRFLEKAVEAASEQKDPALIGSIRLQRAREFERLGHAQLAANEMKEALTAQPLNGTFGRLVVARLKYLYKGGAYEQVAKEALEYRDDPRCKAYRPQILYISWVNHRKRNEPVEAETLAMTLLKEYPENQLCADVFLARALAAMVKGEYEEADRLLEIVECRFPKAEAAMRVRAIRERLNRRQK